MKVVTSKGINRYGELGFDSGDGAWEIATTSKEGSRRANYPINNIEVVTRYILLIKNLNTKNLIFK